MSLASPTAWPARTGGSVGPGRVAGPAAYAALGLCVAVLAGIVAASMWLSTANRAAIETVLRERALLAALVRVVTAANEAETGQRGFLLTDEESYLGPFVRGTATLGPALAAIDQQTSADPASARAAADLRRLVEAKLAELQKTLAFAKAGDHESALAVVRSGRGQEDMDAIRSIADRMQRREQEIITDQFAAINERGGMLVAMDVAGLAGILLLAGIIAWGIRRYLTTLRSAQAQLEAVNRRLEAGNETLERTVQHRTADLMEANEEIQRFAYIVSHDLRAPLVNIMGFTGELEAAAASLSAFVGEIEAKAPGTLPRIVDEAANDDIPEAIRFIKASTAKMDRLIAAILRLSREGRRVLAPERLDMREVLATIAETLQHQATAIGAAIEIGAMPVLLADRVATEQIFGNLMDNALKYLKPGRPGLIKLRGYLEGEVAVFEIEDNGRGIAPKDYERIFELFRRAGDQTVPGEGIGLAHVRTLIRRLGGTITCSSVLDQGTVFQVRLPVTIPTSGNLAA